MCARDLCSMCKYNGEYTYYDCEAKIIENMNILSDALAWIPTSEGLPVNGEKVLVTLWKDTIDIAEFSIKMGVVTVKTEDFELTGDELSEVKAWKPLPEAYKE